MCSDQRGASRRDLLKTACLAAVAGPAGWVSSTAAAATGQPNPDRRPLRVAVVTGGHTYDVPRFHDLFRAMKGVKADVQHLDDFASLPETDRDGYDAVVLYIAMMDGPRDEGLPWYSGRPKEALGHFGATRQGIVVWHHAIVAYPRWPVWAEIVGMADRTLSRYDHDQKMRVNVVDPNHPITRGVASWDMIDETYQMADAGPDSTVLLTVDHPKSMKTIGWTRTHKRARVFCLELGHDNQAWAQPPFRRILLQGIQWTARRS